MSSEQAQKATELNGKQLGEKETLVAKISAPNQKVSRSGAVYDLPCFSSFFLQLVRCVIGADLTGWLM